MNDHKTVAMVTGASSGLGLEYCRQLAERCDVILAVARRLDKLQALAEELSGTTQVLSIEADLSTAEGLASAVEAIREQGPIGILVNNAGYAPYSEFAGSDLAEQRGMIPVHCDATVTLCHAALPAMLEMGQGTIVNVSSLAAFTTGPTLPVYSGTKAFINYFSMGLLSEVGDKGIEVQVFCPGFVHTGMHAPMEEQGFDKAAFPEDMWMDADEAVAYSVNALGSGRLFIIPGEHNVPIAQGAVKALLDSLTQA